SRHLLLGLPSCRRPLGQSIGDGTIRERPPRVPRQYSRGAVSASPGALATHNRQSRGNRVSVRVSASGGCSVRSTGHAFVKSAIPRLFKAISSIRASERACHLRWGRAAAGGWTPLRERERSPWELRIASRISRLTSRPHPWVADMSNRDIS